MKNIHNIRNSELPESIKRIAAKWYYQYKLLHPLLYDITSDILYYDLRGEGKLFSIFPSSSRYDWSEHYDKYYEFEPSVIKIIYKKPMVNVK